MIGVFDSGVGGLAAYKELRRLLPFEDLIYLADRKNAPYGTKARDEIANLVTADIERLVELGADKILIACCTASTIHSNLSSKHREISTPIIPYAAEAVSTDRVCVIATEATVKSHLFKSEILNRIPTASVKEIATQELVALVEHPARYSSSDRRTLLDITAQRISEVAPRELILGCTHFSHIGNDLAERLPSVRIIDTARIAARRMAEDIKKEKGSPRAHSRGRGRNIYT